MSYYDNKRSAFLDLKKWIDRTDRVSWSEFCLLTMETYGFDSKMMNRLLANNYPNYAIKDDKLTVLK